MILEEGRVYARVYQEMVIGIVQRDVFNYHVDPDSVIEITDMDPRPEVNWMYKDGEFVPSSFV